VDPHSPQWHHQYLPSPVPSPPVLSSLPEILLIFIIRVNTLGKGKKKKTPLGGGGVKSEKINCALPFGVLRGGLKIKGGVKLSILYGRFYLSLEN
jgi:hypothetical protein